MLVSLVRRSRGTAATIGEFYREAALEVGVGAPRFPRSHIAIPWLTFHRRDVEVVHDVPFWAGEGQTLRLDVYRPKTAGRRRPAIVQVHGGAWFIGFKEYQGIPLLTHLAQQGWVGFNVDYRLSPRVKWPTHLVDVKRAIAWVREHADEYGVDPDFIVVTGGSAGGHLAAMVGLTPGDPEYQPGFEAADAARFLAMARARPGYFTFGSGGNSKPVEPQLLKVPGVKHVVVEQVWDPAWSSNRLTDEGRRKLGLEG